MPEWMIKLYKDLRDEYHREKGKNCSICFVVARLSGCVRLIDLHESDKDVLLVISDDKSNFKEPPPEDFKRLVSEGSEYDGELNYKFNFPKMCQKYGKAYLYDLNISFLSAQACGKFDAEEFCRINGGVPISFIEKFKPITA